MAEWSKGCGHVMMEWSKGSSHVMNGVVKGVWSKGWSCDGVVARNEITKVPCTKNVLQNVVYPF